MEGGGDQWVEWAYAFDVHLNGFFSLMVMLHGVQLVLVWGECAGVGWGGGECAGVGWCGVGVSVLGWSGGECASVG